MAPPNFLQARLDGVLLAVRLLPRASTNEICGPSGNELRVKVTAPPVDSAANEALVGFLAELLDCGRSRVELVRGRTARHKLVKLHGFAVEEVLTKLTGRKTD